MQHAKNIGRTTSLRLPTDEHQSTRIMQHILRRRVSRMWLPLCVVLICFILVHSAFQLLFLHDETHSRRVHGGGEHLTTLEALLSQNQMHQCRARGKTFTMPRKIPHFMIIGAQKAGTTALFTLLNMEPQAMGSVEIETHFFNHYIFKSKHGRKPVRSLTDEDVCLIRAHYIHKYFPQYARKMNSGQRIVAFEKTPGYIRTPGVATRMHRILGPELKLLAVLRDPIERAFSYYTMIQEHHERTFCFADIGNSFDDLVAYEVEQLRQMGLTNAPSLSSFTNDMSATLFEPPDISPRQLRSIIADRVATSSKIGSERLCGLLWNSLYGGMYSTHLREWLQIYPLDTNLKVIRSEELKQDMKGVYGGVLDFIGLPREHIDEQALTLDMSPQKLGLFNSTRKTIDPPSKRTILYLRKFFQPYNDELVDLLGEEWRGVWGN